MTTLVSMDYDFEELNITFEIEGEWIPGESDEEVGYLGGGDVDNVRLKLGSLNLTPYLTDRAKDMIKEEFLEYCEENVGDN